MDTRQIYQVDPTTIGRPAQVRTDFDNQAQIELQAMAVLIVSHHWRVPKSLLKRGRITIVSSPDSDLKTNRNACSKWP